MHCHALTQKCYVLPCLDPKVLCLAMCSRGSPHKGTKSELAALPLPSRGPKRGRKCHVTHVFSGGPKQGDQIRIGCLTPTSQGPKGGWNCYVTPAFSRVPKQGDKIKIGCLTPAFSGAQKRAEVPRNPCVLGGGGGQTRRPNQNWLPHPDLSGAQRRAEMLRHPCVLGGSPKKGTKSEVKTDARDMMPLVSQSMGL